MYCKHCGKKIPEGSKFCRFCGNSLEKSKTDPHQNENAAVNYDSDKDKGKNTTTLKIIEVVLWVGAGIVLLNLIPDETTQEYSFSIYQILFNELALFSAIGYIRQWYNNFAIPVVLCGLFVFVNIFVTFSIVDIILFSSGVYGVILKQKILNT